MSSEHAKIELRKSQQELRHMLVLAEIFVKFPTTTTTTTDDNPQSSQQFHDKDIIRYYLDESERYITRIETLYSRCHEPWDGLERHVRDVMTRLREKQTRLFVMLDHIKRKQQLQQQQQQQHPTTITSMNSGQPVALSSVQHHHVQPYHQQQQQLKQHPQVKG